MSQVLYPVHVTKQKRKHIQLMCCPDFTISVKAPFYTSEHVINSFIQSKYKWIEKTMASYQHYQHMVFPNPIVFGSMLHYLGKPLKVVLMTTPEHSIFIEDDNLIICFSEVLVQKKLYAFLISWYQKMASDLFTKRLEYWRTRMNVTVDRLIIKQFKSRWGSCSYKKIIALNWILVKSPLDIIDYVIVHECCHLVHFNHSKKFWQLVEFYMPAYKDKKRWLKQYGVFLLQNH